MHHCLQIDEILLVISDAVLNQTQSHKQVLDRQSLLALMKTCRSFSMPAAKVLWTSLPNLAPLILMMPDDLVEIEELGEHAYAFSPRTVTFRRAAELRDWERFDFYAPFVNKIGGAGGKGRSMASFLVLGDEIRRQLKMRDTMLLPNLRTIVASSNDLLLTALLLAPRVQHLQLNLHPLFFPSFFQFVADCSTRVISLRSLYINQSTTWKPTEKGRLFGAVLAFLSRLDVEELECNWYTLSDEMTETLMRMPHLRKMYIRVDIPSLARTLDLTPFTEPRLKDVAIFTDDLVPLRLPQILANLKPFRLETFRLLPADESPPCNQEELHNLILAIQNHCSPKFLTRFSIESESWQSPPPFAAIVDYKMLRPLLSFSKLQRLDLCDYRFDFTDAEVKDLAQSWPLLEFLDISTSFLVDLPPRTTLRCLLWFAIYCRNLTTLHFAFDGMDTFSDDELSMASDHQLSYLCVGCSTIAEPDKACAFFNRVFPNLIFLSWTKNPDITTVTVDGVSAPSSRGEVWRAVEAGIQRLQV